MSRQYGGYGAPPPQYGVAAQYGGASYGGASYGGVSGAYGAPTNAPPSYGAYGAPAYGGPAQSVPQQAQRGPPPPSYAGGPVLSRGDSQGDLEVEMKLGENKQERELYDDLAELFALFKTMDYLEKAYLRDVIAADVYAPECMKLINKFKILTKNLEKSVGDPFTFAEQYQAASQAAIQRFRVGVPANVETEGGAVAVAAEITHHFITAMDSLKLDMRAVDEIRPHIGDIVGSLNRLATLPSDFPGRLKMRNWLTILDGMQASDMLDDSQIRQLTYDIENSYSSFHEFLKGNK